MSAPGGDSQHNTWVIHIIRDLLHDRVVCSVESQKRHAQAKRTEQEMRNEVVALRKDKQDLVERLAALKKKTTGLSKQIDAFRVQAKALAAQAHQRRLEIVSMTSEKTSFGEESFVPTRVVFNERTNNVCATLCELTQSLRVYFLPCPPCSMPLHIPKIAQAGYWFHPPITIPEETPVELVVEAKPHETMTAYCTAVSRTLKEKKPDQQLINRSRVPTYSDSWTRGKAFVKASTLTRDEIIPPLRKSEAIWMMT
ncbi:uncharacterized protein ARMOST_08138 [Armillaria ostoyae]|uniref:Uncharacterized protein n=1 Tax=Armillaria ostoyae TaxID=47428 RepID=A0A284R7R6_ARMOS|nr:uncharacterized protein ARMOST_08138 [Armillaria ostoyae]